MRVARSEPAEPEMKEGILASELQNKNMTTERLPGSKGFSKPRPN